MGDLYDRDSVRRAAEGTRAVFSVQMPDMNDLEGDSELVHATNLVRAARDAGVPQFVHTSVSGAGAHRTAPGWQEGRWKTMEHYFETKTAIQDLVRQAGFAYWTILKPGFFMENFVRPSFLFAHGTEDRLLTIIKPDTTLSLIALRDIGAAAAAAVLDPVAFHQVELELAGERLTMRQIAQVLSDVLGVELTAPSLSLAEAVAQGMPEWGVAHEWQNQVGSPARPEYARALGLPTTDFRTWAAQNM
ncbi:NmrA family NAD(P)-binding protein [Streptomyces sp. NPDC059568]|uniref:NmrA family NAD(P)-binding protein n=1 Tax=Streptomyces sp. NPDC059568 TaxID=3346868 RepID=UPI0036858B27